MPHCKYCKRFKRFKKPNSLGQEEGICGHFRCRVISANRLCGKFEYNSKDFSDELDEYLFDNHQIKSGCCSSIESLKYDIAREVAETLIEKFNVNLQYVSRKEQRKKMDKMYGLDLIKEN